MTIEQETQIIDTNIKFNKADNDNIVSQIVKNWDNWDKDRSAQLSVIEKVEELLDLSAEYKAKKETSFEKKKDVQLKMPDMKEIAKSSIAHLYNATFKTPSQMFNVQLENDLSTSEKAQFAYMQKAAILEVLKKSKSKKEFRKAVENLAIKGEAILYISWHTIMQNVRRKTGFNFMGIDLRKWQVQQQIKYDGVKIRCIEPENFVFDTTRADDFDGGCPKIYRSYKTYQSIANNDNYKQYLDKEALETLENIVKSSDKKDLSFIDEELNPEKAVKDDQIEVLEFIGDISITNDGETKHENNLKIIVVARKYVVCYEYNPNIINPFVYMADEVDKDTGRGIPKLDSIVAMVENCTSVLNKVNKALGLSINKCYLAPKGAFEGDQEVKEGGIIEFDPQFMTIPPRDMDFISGLSYGLQMLEYLENKMEQVTGMFKYATGDDSAIARTATETNATVSGQNVRMGYDLDKLGEFIIETIEKIAELMANYFDQPKPIKYKDQYGIEQNGILDEQVIQGNYIYTIGDTQSILEKKNRGLEFFQALERLGALIPLNGAEILNELGSMYEQENPSRFMMQQQPIVGGLPIGPQGTATTGENVPVMPDGSMEGNPPALPPEDIQGNQFTG